jgi:hypothetical protein
MTAFSKATHIFAVLLNLIANVSVPKPCRLSPYTPNVSSTLGLLSFYPEDGGSISFEKM